MRAQHAAADSADIVAAAGCTAVMADSADIIAAAGCTAAMADAADIVAAAGGTAAMAVGSTAASSLRHRGAPRHTAVCTLALGSHEARENRHDLQSRSVASQTS